MAEEAAKEAAKEVPAAGGSNLKLIIIVAVVSMLTAGISAGVAVVLLGGGSGDEVADAEAAEVVEEEEALKEAIYVNLDPAFVVNFQDTKGRTKFLKAEVNAMTRETDIGDALLKHMPVIRNSLVLLFSRQVYEDLVSHDGKERLRSEALSEVQSVIERETGTEGVEDLLFTSFVMQ